MFVLGTSGHVDHGKSSFLRALTAMEPDRLPEEKKRGMTIDLNFVWIATEKWGRVGIVDVPGHQRFVKNMISGTMNVDAFLFILAADDGWMPQSEEHLGVLKSLGITRGIGIVTKVDLVDEARAREVEAQLAEKLEAALGHPFDVCRFSTEKPELLAPIRARIEGLLESLPRPRDIAAGRFWIDRVFMPKGLGVVVTGTLRDGLLAEGDEVKILPLGRTVQVKSIQSYGEAVREARPVARVAVQLTKVQGNELTRGMLVQKRREVPLTSRIDAIVDWFEPVKGKNVEMAFHYGTARELALVIPIAPGDSGRAGGFTRIRFESALPLRAGDRFVLRTVGEERSLGAGVVADPTPMSASHRKVKDALASWSDSAKGIVEYATRKTPLLELEKLLAESQLSPEELRNVLCDRARFREVAPGLFTETALWTSARDAAKAALDAHAGKHREPLGEGDLLRAVGAKLGVPQKPLRAILASLVAAGEIKKEAKGYLPPGGKAAVDPAEHARRERVRAAVRAGLGQPVSLRELIASSRDLRNSVYEMAKSGELVPLFEEHFIFRENYEPLKGQVEKFLREKGQGTTSELRTYLNMSRKNVVLVLEQMDKDRLTYLKDNVRRLFRP